jgi:hypothetical protein
MRDISGVDPDVYEDPAVWSSWDGDTVAVVLISRPRDVRELVAAMWTHRDLPIRAVGSGWSLSDVHRPIWLAIDLRDSVALPGAFGASAMPFIRPDVIEQGRIFYWIRGGARLHQVTESLWRDGYSFPTLGGSQGQTLAGAMSTGTHGGDFAYSSVTDAIRALHVAVPGGKEYWIEPRASRAVTDLAALRSAYLDWDDDVEVLQHDDAFDASLVSCGRLGVVWVALVEVVAAFYQEQETFWETWKPLPGKRSVEEALRRVISSGSWDDEPLFSGAAPATPSVTTPSFLEIHYDPKGPSSYVRRRWRTSTSSAPVPPAPLLPRPAASGPPCGFEALQFLVNLPSLAIIPEIFAAQHREAYAKALTDGLVAERTVFRDRGYLINVGTLPEGQRWEDVVPQPRVESMEFFFDAMNDNYLDFINGVHDQDWGTIAGGYIAIRYTRTPTSALLGLAPFAQTVAVEVTLIKGFKDGGSTVQYVLQRARNCEAISHWGQENPHSAPVIDRQFGNKIRRWREMIPFLLGDYADAPSNPFTRRTGLEYGPALRIALGRRTVLWLGYNEVTTSTLYHRGFVGPDPGAGALRFGPRNPDGTLRTVLAVEMDGQVQAARLVTLPPRPNDAVIEPGSLVVRRAGQLMAILTPRSDLHVSFQAELPQSLVLTPP